MENKVAIIPNERVIIIGSLIRGRLRGHFIQGCCKNASEALTMIRGVEQLMKRRERKDGN